MNPDPYKARMAVHYLKERNTLPYIPKDLGRALLPYVFIPNANDLAPEKSIFAAKTEAMFKTAMHEEGAPVFGREMLRDYVWTHVTLEALIKFEAMIRADCAAKGEKK